MMSMSPPATQRGPTVTKMLRVCLVAAIACILHATTAYAAADWLDKLSGPGPFKGTYWWLPTLTYRFMCIGAKPTRNPAGKATNEYFVSGLFPWEGAAMSVGDKTGGSLSPRESLSIDAAANRPGDADAHTSCAADTSRMGVALKGYMQVRFSSLKSIRNDLYGVGNSDPRVQVRLESADLMYFARIHDTLDIGTGLGVATFHGDAFDTFERFQLIPVEVSFSPLAVFGDDLTYRWVKVVVNMRTFAPRMTQEDFCRSRCRNGAGFDSRGEYSWGASVNVSPVGAYRFITHH